MHYISPATRDNYSSGRSRQSGVAIRRQWIRPVRRRFREGLDRLAAALVVHQRLFLATAPERTWPLRRDLDHRLRHLFHVLLMQPAGLFAYLAVVAVALERLRAALVSRALFGAEAPR